RAGGRYAGRRRHRSSFRLRQAMRQAGTGLRDADRRAAGLRNRNERRGDADAACPHRRRQPARDSAETECMTAVNDYIRDGTAIYEKSFAIIRAEADLSRFSAGEADIAVRMIHACGLVE